MNQEKITSPRIFLRQDNGEYYKATEIETELEILPLTEADIMPVMKVLSTPSLKYLYEGDDPIANEAKVEIDVIQKKLSTPEVLIKYQTRVKEFGWCRRFKRHRETISYNNHGVLKVVKNGEFFGILTVTLNESREINEKVLFEHLEVSADWKETVIKIEEGGGIRFAL